MNHEQEPQLDANTDPEALLPERLDDDEAKRLICRKVGISEEEYWDYMNMLGSETSEGLAFYPFKAPEALARLLLELRDKISDYDTILCDDTSGRLPAIFLKKIMDKKREEQGKNLVRLKFVAAGKLYSPLFYKIHEFIKEKNKEENWQKVLVVTDHIFSGESMRKLVDILEEENIDFDVAAITAYREKHDKKYEHDPCKDPKILQRLYFGSAISENEASFSPFYQKPRATGVTKDFGLGLNSAHAERINESPEEKEKAFKKGEKTLAENKKQARKGMRDLAEELYRLVE
jgi:adenine/guanine phosphoribosyltransferase-like PRPP-binding protein